MENNSQGVTPAMLVELANKEIILENVKWKPDQLRSGFRSFYPYLSGDFVKRRLIEVLGAHNLQFMLEKDEEFYAKGSIGILMEGGEWNFYSAIGVEKEGKGITDQEKKNKVKFKGNVTDTIKSCAEWLGLMVPAGVTQKKLKEDGGKTVFTSKGDAIGHVNNNSQEINNYLNGISATKYLISQVYSINKEKVNQAEDLQKALSLLMKGLV